MADLTKSIFEILDELNKKDCTHGTPEDGARVKVTIECLGGETIRKNTPVIRMVAPAGSLRDLAFNKRIFMLVSIDREEYFALEEKYTKQTVAANVQGRGGGQIAR